MELKRRNFFGTSKKQFYINGLTIVDSAYDNYLHCPWHYHQNAHFAFTTQGNLIETHKNKKLYLSAGCLMYNHSQEPHYNSDYTEKVSALHVDINEEWFKQYDINFLLIEGVHELNDPLLKNIFINLFKEVKYFDDASSIAIESMILQAINKMVKQSFLQTGSIPVWISKVKDLLYDKYNEQVSLKEIAASVNIHPVYLCQQFPVYFNCNFGEYLRKIKIEKAVQYILNNNRLSLTEISYASGFADQSHFIRTFKKNIGITPRTFKKMLTE